MWKKPWLNRDCLEFVRPALTPRTFTWAFCMGCLGSSKRRAREEQGSELPPSSLDRSTPSTKQHLLSYVSPTPQGPGQRAERGPEGPNTRFSRLSRNSLPVPLLQLCRCQPYCLGLVLDWPLFVCNIFSPVFYPPYAGRLFHLLSLQPKSC